MGTDRFGTSEEMEACPSTNSNYKHTNNDKSTSKRQKGDLLQSKLQSSSISYNSLDRANLLVPLLGLSD